MVFVKWHFLIHVAKGDFEFHLKNGYFYVANSPINSINVFFTEGWPQLYINIVHFLCTKLETMRKILLFKQISRTHFLGFKFFCFGQFWQFMHKFVRGLMPFISYEWLDFIRTYLLESIRWKLYFCPLYLEFTPLAQNYCHWYCTIMAKSR